MGLEIRIRRVDAALRAKIKICAPYLLRVGGLLSWHVPALRNRRVQSVRSCRRRDRVPFQTHCVIHDLCAGKRRAEVGLVLALDPLGGLIGAKNLIPFGMATCDWLVPSLRWSERLSLDEDASSGSARRNVGARRRSKLHLL
jgi:hypothetical protein